MPCFITQLMTILVMIGMVFMIISEMFHGRIPLNSVLLLLLMNFVSGFRLELMYISLIVCIRSSLTHLHGFQLLLLLLQFIEIIFFRLYLQSKPSSSKVKFRQATNCCKWVLEAAKLAYATNTKESITSKKLGSQDFQQIANTVLYLLYSTAQGCCLLLLIKQNCFIKTFLRTLILMIRASLYLFSLAELL